MALALVCACGGQGDSDAASPDARGQLTTEGGTATQQDPQADNQRQHTLQSPMPWTDDKQPCSEPPHPFGLRCGTTATCVNGYWVAEELSCPPEPDPTCVESMPAAGSDCAREGVACEYPGCLGASGARATCRNGQWWVEYERVAGCTPPPIVLVCPERALIPGSACAYEGQACGSPSCDADTALRASVVCSEGVWQQRHVACSE